MFDSLEPIRDLATALPANGERPAGGLADAPAAYGGTAARRFRRKHNHGHRNRLRQRFLEAGPQSLPDYELLELLLFFSIDVKDTKPLAKELLARYGSLGGVLSADPRQFAEFDELRENSDESRGTGVSRERGVSAGARHRARGPLGGGAALARLRGADEGRREIVCIGRGARPRSCSR